MEKIRIKSRELKGGKTHRSEFCNLKKKKLVAFLKEGFFGRGMAGENKNKKSRVERR